MTDRALVSIIIPTYNSQNTIAFCLESIKSQTYEPIEVIVVDGGSEDRTVEICENYSVSVIETDLGMAASRVKGAEISKGEFLLHVDSDMELSQHVVQECVNSMDSYDALIIPEVNTGETYWAKCTDVGKKVSRQKNVGHLRFLSNELYFKLGGHNPKLLYKEDLEFHMLVESSGENIGHISSEIQHHLGKTRLIDLFNHRLKYMRSIDQYKKNRRVEYTPSNDGNCSTWEVIIEDMRNRPKLVVGYIFISFITAIISNYYKFKFNYWNYS
ncbi:glycosyltransferase family 2 protein [Haloarcula sp. CGMCC 1.6347]|uniref:glycosyltransferase family 2 protein n=1 Tax=Haloarcula sp. CGMCC 1.6347 TaxID=3111455 RepID=UPI00300F3B1A